MESEGIEEFLLEFIRQSCSCLVFYPVKQMSGTLLQHVGERGEEGGDEEQEEEEESQHSTSLDVLVRGYSSSTY